MEATKLLHMQDFDVETCQASVVSAQRVDAGKTDIVLDQTCFYARGGGQDWDTGTISTQWYTFAVEEVRLDENGAVHHLGTYTGEEIGRAHV